MDVWSHWLDSVGRNINERMHEIHWGWLQEGADGETDMMMTKMLYTKYIKIQ